MPLYDFHCHRCGSMKCFEGSMDNPPEAPFCRVCDEKMARDYNSRLSIFKPYIEEHVTGVPTLLSTAAERDAFCAQHNVTYDRAGYAKKNWKPPDAADAITEELVAEAIKHERARAAGADIPAIPDLSHLVPSGSGRGFGSGLLPDAPE